MTVAQKLNQLSDKRLIQLANELKQTTVPADAILREVIKGTELDTTAPMLAFVGVGQLLAFELADRLKEKIEWAGYKRDAIDMG